MNPNLKILANGESPEAQKIYYHVSPIYTGEVSQAIFQAIGEVLDDMDSVVKSFYLQVSPYTSDWLLGLWEKEYGLKTVPGMTYEARKKRLMTSSTANSTFTPYGLKKFLEKYVDGSIDIIENTDDNEFGIRIFPRGTVDMVWLKTILDKKKQAHLNYNLMVASQPNLAIRARSRTFRTGSMIMCGMKAPGGSYQEYAGMYPLTMQRCSISDDSATNKKKNFTLPGFGFTKGARFTGYFHNACQTDKLEFVIGGNTYSVKHNGSDTIPDKLKWKAKKFVPFRFNGEHFEIEEDEYFTKECTIAINIDGDLMQNVEGITKNMLDD